MPDDPSLCEPENAIDADRNRRRDDAFLVNQKSDRGRKHSVETRDLPLTLKRHRERQSMLLDPPRVRRGIAAAHHHDVDVRSARMPLLKLRRKIIARTARGI